MHGGVDFLALVVGTMKIAEVYEAQVARWIWRIRCRLSQNTESQWVWSDLLHPTTFGQLGEDAVIDNHLRWLGLPADQPGTYLDVGAHHPTHGSNTYRFYRRGAYGIAVDIGVKKEQLWHRVRSRDRFINAAVVPDSFPGSWVGFHFSGDYGAATDHVAGFGVSAGRDVKVTTVRALRVGDLVADVLANHDWLSAPWRLLNLDIEGLDERVLSDFQLESLRPDVVAVESFLPEGVSDWRKISWYCSESPIVQTMDLAGFSLQSVCGPSLVFVRMASRNQ